ncbi:MAG: DUF2807 domain-containing protein [Flavobacteriales bacterium]|nr:DUF2807 domain-containing protein [Flavobacteriales bacterium]
MKFLSSIIVLMLCLGIYAWTYNSNTFFGGNCKKGKGPVTKENRRVENFEAVDLDISASVILKQGAETSVAVESNADLLPYIKTNVSNNTLMISTKDCNCINSSDGIKVYVTTPVIHDISINGSGDIISKGNIESDKLSCSINGSGDVVMKELNVEHYSVDVNGSGDVILDGSSSKTADININGSGDVISELPTSAVAVSIAGSGDVEVHATSAMDVTIMGSGDVIYHGNPKISHSVMGSGDLIER